MARAEARRLALQAVAEETARIIAEGRAYRAANPEAVALRRLGVRLTDDQFDTNMEAAQQGVTVADYLGGE